jgi:hypothetical protein
VPSRVITFVPVPDRLKGVAPVRMRVPDWAPEAVEKVAVFTAFSLVVTTDPPTVTIPAARLKTPLPSRLLLLPLSLLIVKDPVILRLAMDELIVWVLMAFAVGMVLEPTYIFAHVNVPLPRILLEELLEARLLRVTDPVTVSTTDEFTVSEEEA